MKSKIFYGWYIVFTAFLLSTYHHFVFAYGWSAFINPIIATFGWSMAQISLASSLRGIETGIFNPIWGMVADRWSPQWLMRIGAVTTALGVFCLSQTRNISMYYAGFLLMGVGSSLVTGMLPQTIIARWFRKDMGKANGIYYVSAGIGGALIPLLVKIIDKLSWQTTLVYASFGYLALGLIVSFVIRSKPEDMGLLPDGRAPDQPNRKKAPSLYDFGTPVKKVLRSRAFWSIGVVTLFQYATMSTVMLFAIPYLTGLQMDRALASTVIMLYTLISTFGRVPIGTLSDKVNKKQVVALSAALQGVGLFLFWMMNGTSPFWFIVLFAVVYGCGLSGVMALRAPLLAEYFGTKNFGTVFGITSIFITVASVVSQPVTGWIFDTYHTYKPVWLSLSIFSIIATLLMLIMPSAPKQTITN